MEKGQGSIFKERSVRYLKKGYFKRKQNILGKTESVPQRWVGSILNYFLKSLPTHRKSFPCVLNVLKPSNQNILKLGSEISWASSRKC